MDEKKSKPKLFLQNQLKESLKSMQKSFIYQMDLFQKSEPSTSHSVTTENENENIDMTEKNLEDTDIGKMDEKNEEVTLTKPSPSQQKKKSRFNAVPAFKDLSIEEKIDYMLNFPVQLSTPYCKFFLDSRTVIGKILSYENEIIKIETRKGNLKELPIVEVKNITIAV